MKRCDIAHGGLLSHALLNAMMVMTRHTQIARRIASLYATQRIQKIVSRMALLAELLTRATSISGDASRQIVQCAAQVGQALILMDRPIHARPAPQDFAEVQLSTFAALIWQ